MKKPKLLPKDFTPEQAEYALKNVARRGASWTAKKLGTNTHTLAAWARRRGVSSSEIEGRMPAAEVAARAGVDGAAVRKAAARDGALVKAGYKALVLVRWGEKYIAEKLALKANAELLEAGWMTTAQVVEYLGVSRPTVLQAVAGAGSLAPFLQGRAKQALIGKNTRINQIYDPAAVEAARRAMDQARYEAKQAVSIKSLAADFGVAKDNIYVFARSKGIKVMAPRTGRSMTARVSKEDAEWIRENYKPRTEQVIATPGGVVLEFGDYVEFSATLERKSRGGERAWVREELKEARRGIVIGTRILRDGELSEEDEFGGMPRFVQKAKFRAALVAHNMTENPVYVSLEDIEVEERAPSDERAETGEHQSDTEAFSELPRGKRPRDRRGRDAGFQSVP